MTCCTPNEALACLDFLTGQALQGDRLSQRLLAKQVDHWLKVQHG